MIPEGIRSLVAQSAVSTSRLRLITLEQVTTRSISCATVSLTLTFLRLHIRQPPLDFRCGFLLTKPALRRAISFNRRDVQWLDSVYMHHHHLQD
jgi:hypothetical protein